MSATRSLRIAVGIALVAGSTLARADMQQDVLDLQHRWAAVNYHTSAHDQEAAFGKLADAAQQVAAKYPQQAGPLVWQAIILSSEAKAGGGLSALHEVKQARQLLLDAEKIDPAAMDGSIYCTLGSLYAKVPGWPIGYGDKKKADAYFRKALAIDAHSIDSNYLYADLLADQGDVADAIAHLNTALAAPARPERADADQGRRQEIQQLLAKLQPKHGA